MAAACSSLGTLVRGGHRGCVGLQESCVLSQDHPLQGVFCFLSYRFYYTVLPGKMHFERTFRDWEPGCRIVCSECRQVSSWAVTQPRSKKQELRFPLAVGAARMERCQGSC